MDESEFCANCLCSLEPKSSFNIIYPNLHLDRNEYSPEVRVSKISVAASLFTIFNISFSEDQISICSSCHEDLINLFCGFVKFMHRKRQESLISIKLQEDSNSQKPTQLKDKKLWTIWKSLNSNADNLIPNPPQILVNPNESLHNSNALQQSTNDEEENNEEMEMEVEIKEEEEQVDEYEDPLQQIDEDFSSASTKQKRQPDKKRKKTEEIEIDELPTFVAEYQLPDPSEYSLYHLEQLQLPLKCPFEKCPLNLNSTHDDNPNFTTFSQYKNHVSSQHLHNKILKCSECKYGVRNFKLYFNHNVRMHDKRPIKPEEGLPNLDQILDKHLLPKKEQPNSVDEAANIWCFLNPEIVNKYDAEFKQTGSGGEMSFKCEKCFLDSPVTFERKELLYFHLNQNVHESKVFKCDFKGCQCKFVGKNSDSRFIFHCQRFHKLNLTPSDLSKYLTKNPQRLENIVTGGDESESGKKGVKETQKIRFLRKMQKGIYEILGDPPFSCVLTGKNNNCHNPNFLTALDLWKHFKTVHFSENHYPCVRCDRVFEKRCNLDEHIIRFCSRGRRRKKIFLPPFICEKCVPSREFSTWLKLKHHLKINHERPEKTHTCETCGKSFSFQNNLQRHMEYHKKSRPFVCELCGKCYKTNTNLAAHRRNTHDEEGRLKYNAYCRMKNKRWKINKQNQNQDENSTNSTFDLQTENDDENSK